MYEARRKTSWSPYQFSNTLVIKQALPEDIRTQMKQKKYLAEKYDAEKVSSGLSLGYPDVVKRISSLV